jgi:hypothetical protein
MDVGSVLGIAQGLAEQRTSQARLEATLHTIKGYQDLQANIVARLLASLPSANPDGVGGNLDVTA